MDKEDRLPDRDDPAAQAMPDEPDQPRPRPLLREDTDRGDDAGDIDGPSPDQPRRPLLPGEALPEFPGEQEAFREQFDEDLYNDREDRPAQGNTADVAMGEQRFGSEADAYAEYAWRRPGDHHTADASAVGQARDPADVADEDDRR